MPFTSLGLSKSLLDTLAEQNYAKPYPIQEQAIPAILKDRDVLGIAPTGSGKTASYVLPILMNMQYTEAAKNRQANVLVVVPTRELAIQVKDVFHDFNKGLKKPVRILAVHGGVSINPQMKAMKGIHVLVATPGRLLDLVDSNAVQLDKVETLVLDEADKMLNLGFKKEMNRIFELLPVKRQNLLFSATLSNDLDSITQILLRKPLVIKIETEQNHIEKIEQSAYFVPDEKKGPMLRYIIRTNKMKQVLIFASSVYSANNIADKLRKNKVDAAAIHGKKSQGTRKELLQKFKTGKLQVLVATDLLSRGIDIDFLPCVINYELPRSPKDYIHRIGRTGRAEASGQAISLVSPDEEHHFKIIQKKMKRWVDRVNTDDIDLHGY
jgi:ATP-dependent RNA helicase RhlE